MPFSTLHHTQRVRSRFADGGISGWDRQLQCWPTITYCRRLIHLSSFDLIGKSRSTADSSTLCCLTRHSGLFASGFANQLEVQNQRLQIKHTSKVYRLWPSNTIYWHFHTTLHVTDPIWPLEQLPILVLYNHYDFWHTASHYGTFSQHFLHFDQHSYPILLRVPQRNRMWHDILWRTKGLVVVEFGSHLRAFPRYFAFLSPKWRVKLPLVPVLTTYFDISQPE